MAQRQPSTRISLTVRGVFDDVHEDLSLAVYRVIQEALTNIGKHAAACVASITLEREQSPAAIHLIVADDGRGLSPGDDRHHFGLRGIRERMEMAGGSFTLHSAPGAGVQMDVRLPE